MASYNNVSKMFGDEFLDDIITFLANNYDPDDIFDDDVLEEWARDNGYVSEDEVEYS